MSSLIAQLYIPLCEEILAHTSAQRHAIDLFNHMGISCTEDKHKLYLIGKTSLVIMEDNCIKTI